MDKKQKLEAVVEIVLRVYFSRKDGYIMRKAPQIGDLAKTISAQYFNALENKVNLKKELEIARKKIKFDPVESKVRYENGNFTKEHIKKMDEVLSVINKK
jgi:hypothetical protein